MKIFLIRHGETNGDVEDRYGGDYDDDLTSTGMTQAKELAQKMSAEDIDIVYSSPLKRARQTAKIIAEKLKVKVEVVEGFRERNNYGILTGLLKSDALEKYPHEVSKLSDDKYRHSVKNSEPYEEAVERVGKALDYVISSGNKCAAIVSHGKIMGCLMREILGKDFARFGDCGFVILEDKKLVSIHPT